jgi:kynurenine formamidase
MSKKFGFVSSVLILAMFVFSAQGLAKATPAMSLVDMVKTMKTMTWVDLTHAFNKDTPHWKGFDNTFDKKCLFHYDPGVGSDGYGFLIHKITLVGQWGTHCDPPAHFWHGKRTMDQIDVKEMLMPLVVFDVHQKVAANPDYVLSMNDIKEWEKKYGPVPEGSFCAMRTDWSQYWPSNEKIANKDKDGVDHYPGWSMEVLKYLYEVRHITASGHETTDTDPGLQTTKDNYECEAYILSLDHYQIELLCNLDKVPESGAIVVVTWPKLEFGAGFPARAFAIIPNK